MDRGLVQLIIQHNPTPSKGRGGYDAQNGRGNAHINPNRDRKHGRIYRVVYEDNSETDIPLLEQSKTSTLVAALDHDNQFWRLTAQRLLVERKKKGCCANASQTGQGWGSWGNSCSLGTGGSENLMTKPTDLL